MTRIDDPAAGAGRADPDDATLFARARAGDPQAFAAIYERYHGPVTGYLYRRVRDTETAHDLTQETFARAYRHLTRTTGTNLRGWLYRIAHNAALDELRHRQVERRPQPVRDAERAGVHHARAPGGGDRHAGVVAVALPEVPDRADDPEQQALRAELWATTRAVLARLPPRQRQALVLWHDEAPGGYAALAARLGTTPTAVKTLLHRGRQAARAHARDLWG
jgi:RNA polymerase sigma-70 factor (ECF subfamily)